MLQAPMFDGLAFDVGPLAQDVGGSAEVGVCRRHVAQALVVSGRRWANSKACNRSFQITRIEISFTLASFLKPCAKIGRSWVPKTRNTLYVAALTLKIF